MKTAISKAFDEPATGAKLQEPAGTKPDTAGNLGDDVLPKFRRKQMPRAKTLAERVGFVMANYWPDDNGCWNWRGATNQFGYPHAMSLQNGKKVLLRPTRIAAERAYGPIPPKMQVCHKCDNRRCINPEHLFLGTAKDNIRDMMAKGRQNFEGLNRAGRIPKAAKA
jgi:hypothetical protein